jgi:FG-GAP repeat/FG-GAP-like repeat
MSSKSVARHLAFVTAMAIVLSASLSVSAWALAASQRVASASTSTTARSSERKDAQTALSDFNGDGYNDLAVGVPFEGSRTIRQTGAVNVLYGTAAGLQATTPDDQLWTQNTPGVKDTAEAGDQFGWSVAAGDFNADGFTDLAVGTPFESVGTVTGAGAVNVLYGSAAGLQASGSGGPDDQLWTQNSPGVAGDGAEQDDNFARSLGAGDFNGDGFEDLALGVPNEDVLTIFDAGAVNILYGSATGLTATGSQFWDQDSPGMVSDGAESGDRFGRQVGAGDFNGDGADDMVVGIRFEDVGTVFDAGAANVMYGGAGGLSTAGSQFWNQNSPDIAGDGAQKNDRFAAGVATGDFNADGFVDLAIGVSNEGIGNAFTCGAVHTLYGSTAGLQDTGIGGPDDQFWTQDAPGIGGDGAEFGDRFGRQEVSGDFNQDGFMDLAVGVYLEDVGDVVDAGAVNVLLGSSAGLTTTGSQYFDQNSPGMAGDGAESGDTMGGPAGLAAADFNGDGWPDLAIASRSEDVGAVIDAGATIVMYSSGSEGLTTTGSQFWTQDSADVKDASERDDEFGILAGGSD